MSSPIDIPSGCIGLGQALEPKKKAIFKDCFFSFSCYNLIVKNKRKVF